MLKKREEGIEKNSTFTNENKICQEREGKILRKEKDDTSRWSPKEKRREKGYQETICFRWVWRFEFVTTC